MKPLFRFTAILILIALIAIPLTAQTVTYVSPRFDSLNVRIFDFFFFKQEPSRNFRIFAGKFRAHPAQKYEFAFVVAKQFVAHCDFLVKLLSLIR